MSTQTDGEKVRGVFDPHKPTQADYDLYFSYSTFRLRLLSWFGDPVAKRILGGK